MPDPVVSMLLGEPDFILPVAAPVVVPFFMFVCLVVLLVAPGPTFPSLDAPGAGCICANAPPVDSNRAYAQASMFFFMLGTPLVTATVQPKLTPRVPTQTSEWPSRPGEHQVFGFLPPELLIGRDGLVGQHQPPPFARLTINSTVSL